MTVKKEVPAKPLLVAVVTHPIQYYAPLYRALAERGEIDFHVVYLSDAGATAYGDAGFNRMVAWDVPLLEGYKFTVLQQGTELNGRRFWGRHDAQLAGLLARLSPDWLLLYGYASRMNWVALFWARKHGVQVAYTSDSNIHDPKRSWIQPIKQRVLGIFFKSITAFLCTSEANKAYLTSFGVSADRIQRVPFAVDVARFQFAAPLPGVHRPYDFIWAGKFIPLKRAADFIAALPIVADALGRSVKACVVGDGPLRDEVHAQAAELPAQCVVDFLGFQNQAAMPHALQQANTLVLSSDREAYGLIATEAAAAGLALVVSDRVGCVGATVLARPGVNALTYPAGNVGSLAEAMLSLLKDPLLLKRMQEASMAISRFNNIDSAAAVIEKTVTQGLE